MLASTGKSVAGNTIATTSSRRSVKWCFTLNNYNEDDIGKLTSYFSDAKYVFQEETGEEEKTPHLQGCVKFKNGKRFTTLVKLNKKIHWEPCKSWKDSVIYCSKEDTRSGNMYTNIPTLEKIEDPFDGKSPYPWQKDVLELIKEKPDKRSINWYYDETGCTGKTSLAKKIVMDRKDAVDVAGS